MLKLRLSGKARDVFPEIKRICITDRPIDMEPTRVMWINPDDKPLLERQIDEIQRRKRW